MPRSRLPGIIHVHGDGHLTFGRMRFRCTLGRTGIVRDKREGDGGTPIGLFPVRAVWYRPEFGVPCTALPRAPIGRSLGWCDDADNANYNRPIRLPYAGSHEVMRRTDRLYDVVLSIGQNDRPCRPGRGSAIFVHMMSPSRAPTEGCVALQPDDLRWLLSRLKPGDLIKVHDPESRAPQLP